MDSLIKDLSDTVDSRSACLGMDPQLWFAESDEVLGSDGNHAAEAVAVCAVCPVGQECIVLAVLRGEQFGIWGGLGASGKLKFGRRLLDEEGVQSLARWARLEFESVQTDESPWQPKTECPRCGGMIPAGRRPVDRNTAGTRCLSSVAYEKGARCKAARIGKAMRSRGASAADLDRYRSKYERVKTLAAA